MSVFLRGTNSNHTLVLIDAIRANLPADGRFDFDTIPSENIERIKILRGPQSAHYGSDAIGGVINIISRRGSGPFQTGGGVELGSNSINKQVVIRCNSTKTEPKSDVCIKLRVSFFVFDSPCPIPLLSMPRC